MKLLVLDRITLNHLTICHKTVSKFVLAIPDIFFHEQIKLLVLHGNTRNYLTVIIIIITMCHQHRYPWPSLATTSHHPSLAAAPHRYIPYLHRAAVCKFELVWRGPQEYITLQCRAYLVCLIFIVFVMLYSCCFVGCCLQSLFNIARNILV